MPVFPRTLTRQHVSEKGFAQPARKASSTGWFDKGVPNTSPRALVSATRTIIALSRADNSVLRVSVCPQGNEEQ